MRGVMALLSEAPREKRLGLEKKTRAVFAPEGAGFFATGALSQQQKPAAGKEQGTMLWCKYCELQPHVPYSYTWFLNRHFCLNTEGGVRTCVLYSGVYKQ